MDSTFALLAARLARNHSPLPWNHPASTGVSNTVGGESSMRCRVLAVLAAACLSTLLLSVVQGCRRLAPPPLGHETRASLGSVGVYSVGPPPDVSISGSVGVGRQRLKGAAKGGGVGFVSGLGVGALTGAGIGLACGPLAVLCSPVLALWGGVIGGAGGLVTGSAIGAVHRGANATPTDVAESARAAIFAAITGRDLRADMRRRVLDVGNKAGNWIDLGGDDAVDSASTVDYGRFTERGAHAVLEIGIVQLALTGEGGSNPDLVLTIQARARLIAIPDNRVLWSDEQLSFGSSEAQLSVWTAEDSRLLKSELDRGLEILARRIGSEVFPKAGSSPSSPPMWSSSTTSAST